MASSLAARRLRIMAAARAAGGELLCLDPARLRFSLGTSIADVRVPVQVAPAARDIVRSAAAELAMLLASQPRALVPVDEIDRVYLADGYATLPAPSATLGPSRGGADLRAASQIGAAAHPALTGGIGCAWMGPGGRGRVARGPPRAAPRSVPESGHLHRCLGRVPHRPRPRDARRWVRPGG